MSETLKSIQLDGDGNVILQHVSAQGDITINTLDWDTFVQRYTFEQQERIAELKEQLALHKENKELLNEKVLRLSQEMNQLQAEKERIEAQVKHMIQEYADKDLSQTDARYREAFELFLAGKLDEALAVLDDAKLEAELHKAQEAQRQVAQSYRLKADILQLQYQFKEAEAYLHRAYAAYPDWGNCFSLASIYHKLERFSEAEAHFQKCIKLVGNEEELAVTLENLADLQVAGEKYDLAKENYWKALKLYDKLAEYNSKDYSLNYAIILGGLKTIGEKNKNQISEELQWRVLKIQRKSAETMPQAFDLPVCETSLNLVIFYFGKFQNGNGTKEDAQQLVALLLDVETRLQRFSQDIPLVQRMWNDVHHFKQLSSEAAAGREDVNRRM